METIACITTYFNPAGYRTRRENFSIFAESLASQGVPLVTVELAFGEDPFELAPSPSVIQLRGRSRLWMKERLINAAVARLPDRFKAFTWIDADVLFGDPEWFWRLAEKLETDDVVQLFDRVVHLPPGHRRDLGEDVGHDTGLVAQVMGTPNWLARRLGGELPFAVPGYAWAAQRKLFCDRGLYDRSILGNNDVVLADCLFDSFGIYHYTSKLTAAMADDMEEWRRLVFGDREVRAGYLPVTIYHLWHGSFDDRGYCSRDDILHRHGFDPRQDLTLVGDVYEWSSEKPALHADVAGYFAARHEDGD
jgi:hypothetical protein